MKILRKIVMIFIIIVLTLTLIDNTKLNIFAKSDLGNREIVNVGALFYNLNDEYVQIIKLALEEIQKNNSDKVEFNFYDAKNNISEQNALLSNMINSNFNLLVLDLFNVSEAELGNIIVTLKGKDVPAIFLNVNPQEAANLSKYYNKAIFMASDYKILGIEQANIIDDLWNNNRNAIDKNGDGVLNYIIIKGKKGNPRSNEMTEGFISTIKNLGIESNKLEEIDADWSRELAKNAISTFFIKYGSSIEAIIANSDSMAIGAVEALQGFGYNSGDKSKNIMIISNDGFQITKELIDKGFITATIDHDKKFVANAIYNIGMNLVNNMDPIENTNYKFENGQIIIPIIYRIYINKSNI